MDRTQDLQQLRHSAAHLLAHAVSQLYPDTLMTIGPATEEGFFYDFLPTTTFKEEDLPAIQARMHELAKQNLPITHTQISKARARELYKNNPFKLELIDEIPGDTVGLAEQGDFYDLCKGGHVATTGDIRHFKLLFVSGSYWRANKKNTALQRITGTAFATEKELTDFVQRREDAIKFDHRRLGKELDLFSFHEEGPGFPFFHAHGKTILNTLTNYLRTLLEKAGYQEIGTPTMLSDELWQQSGHYAHYKDNMYFCEIEDRSFAIKPMNCPGSILIYKERPHSYRELPLRLAEFGHVHRYELSGVLHGMFRARAFTIDDGHIYCTPEQIEAEVCSALELTMQVLKRFNFQSLTVALSTRPENAMGSKQVWDHATDALKRALDKAGIAYTLQEGEGAFYGPKIEFHIKDSMERSWQCGTIQLDFFLPENFDLTYVTNEGTKARPVMIHRAIFGSFERFFAILLEHYKGKLPFWLAPQQIIALTITDDQKPYAQTIIDALKKEGIRAHMDNSSDQISAKIKNAQLKQIPWMLVIGKKEVEQQTVTLRFLDGKQEFGITLPTLLERAMKENVA
jgi:threonyl-tRNA synthetase